MVMKQELKALKGHLEELQIDIERNEKEVEECHALHAMVEEATCIQRELDLLEEAISHLPW